MEQFEELNGRTFPFYGASERQFKLGETVWEAVEDESDGYRSYLGSIERKESDAIFFQAPIAEVRVVPREDGGTPEGWKLVDIADGHMWLEIGTDNSDDYYPWFVFNYQPKGERSKAGEAKAGRRVT